MFVFALIAFLLVLLTASAYLGFAFHRFYPGWARKRWVIFFLLLSVPGSAAKLLLTTTDNPVGRIVFCVAALVQGFLIFLLLASFLMDGLSIFFRIRGRIRGFLVLLLSTIVCAYGIINATRPGMDEINIPIHGLSHEIRVVQVSDIHLGDFRGKDHLQRIVNLINKVNPDVVLNTGDLFDSRFRLHPEVLKPLTEIHCPQFFVEGNHDQDVGAERIASMLRNLGVTVLENEVTMFGELQIVGLRFMKPDHKAFDLHPTGKETIEEVLNRLKIDPAKPTLLMQHGPNGSKYVAQHGIDVMLAGHTHGGQIFPLTIFEGLIVDFNKGLHQVNGLSVYVSQGLGTSFVPMRVGVSSQLTLIHLVPEQ